MQNILVSVASYKDPDLYPTIQNAIKMAEHPERVSFVVCFQEEVSKDDYKAMKEMPNVRIAAISPKESRGTGWARHLLCNMVADEDYMLQIDSHTRFIKNWDSELIAMLDYCEDEKCCLSAYCFMLDDYWIYEHSLEEGKPITHSGYTLAADYFLPDGVPLIFHGAEVKGQSKPYKGAFISGHFLFGKAEMFKEVPYDPQIYFWGEEISYAVRLWTSGYNIYHPYKQIVYHEYNEVADSKVKYRPLHSDEHNRYLFDYLSKSHVNKVLTGCDDGIYGLGNERSLEQYEKYSGVDFRNRTIRLKAVVGMYDDYSGKLHSYALNKDMLWDPSMGADIIERDQYKIDAERNKGKE